MSCSCLLLSALLVELCVGSGVLPGLCILRLLHLKYIPISTAPLAVCLDRIRENVSTAIAFTSGT